MEIMFHLASAISYKNSSTIYICLVIKKVYCWLYFHSNNSEYSLVHDDNIKLELLVRVLSLIENSHRYEIHTL